MAGPGRARTSEARLQREHHMDRLLNPILGDFLGGAPNGA